MKKYTFEYHPDKNKDKNAQATLLKYKEYFDILEDDSKRTIYDKYGLEEAKKAGKEGYPGGGGGGAGGGFGGFGGFEDIFEKFFGGGGGGGGGRQHRQVRRTPDSQVKIQVSLKDAFMGGIHHFQLPRTILCKKCKGVGANDPRDVATCSGCQGTGAKTYYRQFGPGMVQQVRTVCDQCQGKGKTFKSKCSSCKGNKVERITETLEIKIDPGISDGTTVKYSDKADESPEHETGDLFVTIGVDTHPQFRRDGANLYTKVTISLEEVCKSIFKLISIICRQSWALTKLSNI